MHRGRVIVLSFIGTGQANVKLGISRVIVQTRARSGRTRREFRRYRIQVGTGAGNQVSLRLSLPVLPPPVRQVQYDSR